MNNCVVGWPIYTDPGPVYIPSFSGGAWFSTLPLTMLQDRRLSQVARSVDATTASTQFVVDMKTTRSLRAIGFMFHNFSLAATVQLRVSANANLSSPTYNQTPNAYDAGITAEYLAYWGRIPFIHVMSAAASGRYLGVNITDTSNPAGYVEIGRLAGCGGFQPTINIAYGAKIRFDTSSVRTELAGGADSHNERPIRRIVDVAIQDLPQDEALAGPFDLQRQLGTVGQLLFAWDAADTTHMHRRAIFGSQREMSSFEMRSLSRYGFPLSIIESIAGNGS